MTSLLNSLWTFVFVSIALMGWDASILYNAKMEAQNAARDFSRLYALGTFVDIDSDLEVSDDACAAFNGNDLTVTIPEGCYCYTATIIDPNPPHTGYEVYDNCYYNGYIPYTYNHIDFENVKGLYFANEDDYTVQFIEDGSYVSGDNYIWTYVYLDASSIGLLTSVMGLSPAYVKAAVVVPDKIEANSAQNDDYYGDPPI